ncbi:MAG: hypothetical protein OEM02_01250 [Desulfobulbaceae bacterium]|nr:hypothetical protein [Desulfobulbaceae bacterium]
MLSKYEINRLESYDKKGKNVIILGLILVSLCWLTAAFNYQQAMAFSGKNNVELMNVIDSWSNGITLPAYYTGTFVQITQHLMLSLIDLALGFVFGTFLLMYIREGILQRKVLRVLKENHVLPSA